MESPCFRFCGPEVQTASLGACVLDSRPLGQQVGLVVCVQARVPALGSSREQAAKLPFILEERLTPPNT